MSKYCALGPTLERYKLTVKNHKPNETIALLRGMKETAFTGSYEELHNFYQQNELFRPTGSVYSYYVVNEADTIESQVYPAAHWLNLMQKPVMSEQAKQEADAEFRRLMTPPAEKDGWDFTDNYIQSSVKWRGLEHKVIMQVLTPTNLKGMSENTAVLRPMYLHIDPFLLLQLDPMVDGMRRSDAVMAESASEVKESVPDNVSSIFTPPKERN